MAKNFTMYTFERKNGLSKSFSISGLLWPYCPFGWALGLSFRGAYLRLSHLNQPKFIGPAPSSMGFISPITFLCPLTNTLQS